MQKNRFFIFYLITFILTIFSCLFLAEGLLRIYGIFYPNLFISADLSYNRFRGEPFAKVNGFQLNSFGFQDLEFEKKKRKDIHRIVALGDSFAYGVVPYENNFLTLLEEQLNASHSKFEIINMGIPSIGLEDYKSLLIHEGLETGPDSILLCFFIGNDIFDHIKKESDYFYLQTFYKYIQAYVKIQNESIKPSFNSFQVENNNYLDNNKTFSDSDFFRIEKARSVVFSKNTIVNQHLNEIYKSLFLNFDQIKKICDENKMNLFVVFIPDEMQINQKIQNNLKDLIFSTEQIHPLIPNEYLLDLDYEQPNRILGQAMKDRNIIYIDLLDPFLKESNKVNLYKPNDTHWNIAGNKLAAKLIEEFLLKQEKLLQN